MDRLKITDSYKRFEMIAEDYNKAVSDRNWKKALELNEECYRESIDRYLMGDYGDKICAMKDLMELSGIYWFLKNQPGGEDD